MKLSKDGDKEYLRPQPNLNSSQDLMQSPPADEQKSTFVSNYSGSTPTVASLGQKVRNLRVQSSDKEVPTKQSEGLPMVPKKQQNLMERRTKR